MAFSVAARVKVIDLSNDHRTQLGTVMSVSGDAHQVRLDGQGTDDRVLLYTNQLGTTTLPSTVTY